MMTRIVSAAAIAALMSTAAMAQQMNPPAHPSPGAPAMQPAPKTPSGHMSQSMPSATSVKVLTSLPANAKTVTNWYKQSVYDPSDKKIGDVDDVLVSNDGKIEAAMIAVGGFLGIGEKDVAVPFESLKLTQKNSKAYLVMNATKDELKNAPGFKYDRNTTTWVSDKSASATPSNRSARE
jgi:sporulation protein YlmC with PRC-barrel domain